MSFLKELGGSNSRRLVLGGLLADLSAEHYIWVAKGMTTMASGSASYCYHAEVTRRAPL